jgi:hypothetical protein
MKKFATNFFLIASLLIILSSFNFWDGVVIFFMAGIVPGTNTQLSPEQMAGLYLIGVSLIVAHYNQPNRQKINPKPTTKASMS